MGMMEASSSALSRRLPRILIVDDDPAVQRMISTCMNDHNMSATAVADRQGMLRALSAREPDLVILDLHLGSEDGLALLRDLRSRSVVPVILITGHRKDEVDRIVGLEMGADDYVTKPFSLRELLARSRALIRRRTMDTLHPVRRQHHTFAFEGWIFDQRDRILTSPAGEVVFLTKGEFALLSAFVASPGRTLTREHLLQATRIHEDVFDRSIDVQILRLRRKLKDDPAAPRFIRTERGVGYVFVAAVEAP